MVFRFWATIGNPLQIFYEGTARWIIRIAGNFGQGVTLLFLMRVRKTYFIYIYKLFIYSIYIIFICVRKFDGFAQQFIRQSISTNWFFLQFNIFILTYIINNQTEVSFIKMDQNQSYIGQGNIQIKQQQQAYKKIKVLGEGAMGKAYLVQSNVDQKFYVMKRINIGHLSPEQKESAMRQAQLHSIVSHPNIIAFKEIYHTTKDKLCIIMEYAQNGDLEQFLLEQNGKFLSQDIVLNYFSQICMGLRQIHSKKIIHRDIKSANIFLSKDNTVKIGDFGISKVIDQTVQASKSFVGTPYYLSPEMVEGKPYSTKADIWALGVLLYYMCALKLPFEANSLPLLALKILKGSFPPLSGPYTRDLKTLILGMLQVDAKKRPTALDILMKPLISKYLPKQQIENLQLLKQKPKIPKNPTLANMASPIVGKSVKPQKKSTSTKLKISEQEKKQKQKQLREEKKKKRDEQFKQMKDDLRKKRLEAQKQKLGSTKAIESTLTTEHISLTVKNLKKNSIQKSPNKNKIQQKEEIKNLQKPWRTVKNKGNSKKDIQVEILVPTIKVKNPPKQPELPPGFKIEIKQYGKKPQPIEAQNEQYNQQFEGQNEHESSQIEAEQNQEISEEYDQGQQQNVDYKQMMDQLNNAQMAVQGLKLNMNKKIQLYEQSENFSDSNERDNQILEQKQRSSKKPQTPQMNTLEEQSWNFIQNRTNSDNLQQCRQVLEQGLGQEKFMRAYQILNEHLQNSEKRKMRGEQLDDYTFNKQVLKSKLQFLSEKQFEDYLVLMYTLIVIEIEEMKKNFDQ